MNWFRKAEIRLQFLGLFMLTIMSIMVARLWYVQVKDSKRYVDRIQRGSEITVRLPSIRGEIKDRNGVPLVSNKGNFEVDFYLPAIVSAYLDEHKSTPKHVVERVSSGGQLRLDKETDILPIMEETIMPRLAQLSEKGVDVLREYNSEQLQRHFSNDKYVPFPYIDQLDIATVCQLAEHDVALPGVELSQKGVRHYIYGSLAAHVLGYVGSPVSIKDQPDIDQFNYYQPDIEGKLNIERACDADLRGKPGIRVLRKNAKGRIDGVAREIPPVPGSDVYLTIDARIQYITEMALRQSGAGRAAAVVVDPNNGNILAMASVPSFDPNIFIPSISEENWKTLQDDPTIPLMNRAIQGFAPGSTYKIMVALAGLNAGVKPTTRFTCTGYVTYGDKPMKCWIAGKGSHGSVDISSSIKYSCNAFYYQFGNAAGIDAIDDIGKALGFGQPGFAAIPALNGQPAKPAEITGENPGILPGKNWLAEIYKEKWTPAQTANTSIGQGFVLASPLQMAMLAATVANGGICYYPRIVDKVVEASGVVKQDPPRMRTSLIQKGMTPEMIEIVRNGMRRVVNEEGGTARRGAIKGIELAGKTGTAQAWRTTGEKDNHVWFISFAPYTDPKLAVAVLIQGGKSGGGVAAPVAKKIIEESLAIEKGYNPPLAPLEPAKGSFKQLDSVDFTSVVPAEFTLDDETSDSDTVQARQFNESDPVQRASRPKPDNEKPNVKKAPDERGKVQATEKKRGFLDKLFNRNRSDSSKNAAKPARKPGNSR